MKPETRLRAALVSACFVLACLLCTESAGQVDRTVGRDGRPTGAITAANVVVPQHRVIHVPRPAQTPVTLTTVEAGIRISEQVARTSLRMTLANQSSTIQEAQFLVPLPDGAVVRGFELEGLGEEGIAKILPRDEARRIYDDIVRRVRDPGLLEFAGYNLVRSSVFPVPPRGTQAVELVYEQVLASESGRVDFVLPRSESLESTGVKWSFDVEIRAGRPVSTVYSPSHEIDLERVDSGHLRLTVPGPSAVADVGSFRLSYLLQQSAGQALPASLVAYPDPTVGDGEGGYFLLLAGLPAGRPADLKPVKREVIVALDRSGSMRGEKIEQAREAALQILEALDDGEAFNILDYANSVEMFSARSVLKDAGSMTDARKYLGAIKATGGTSLHDAIVESLRQPVTPNTLPMVLFLSDGLPTIGERREVAIREAAELANKHRRRIFTFGVGYDVNAPLLTHLALNSRAKSTFVLPEEDVEVKVGQVFRKLSGPVLSTPELTALDRNGRLTTRAVRELLPATIPDLFEGEQLVLLGKYTKDEPIRLRLSGDYFNRHREFDLRFDIEAATTRNAYVPRLWAGRRITALVDTIREMGADGNDAAADDPRFKELVDEIVALSTRWGILTEYTSFLATEGSTPVEMSSNDIAHGFRSEAGALLEERAMKDRAATPGAVSQEKNQAARRWQKKLDTRNRYVDEEFNVVEVGGVRQVADRALFLRGARWVDGAILDRASEAPESVVEFGTAEFDRLLARLAAERRQGLLSMGDEVYLLIDDQRVLVRLPKS